MTREEAVEMIQSMGKYLSEGNPIWETEPVKEATRMAIESLSAEAGHGWVPCSERLPKTGEQVLCCDSQSRVFTSALTEIASNGMTFFGQHCKVIAWTPLPKPYREDGEV